MADKIFYCNFCGKTQQEVRKLIAGPTVFICDECIELCMDIIQEKRDRRVDGEPEYASWVLDAPQPPTPVEQLADALIAHLAMRGFIITPNS